MQLLPFSLLVREFIGGTPLDPPENCTPPLSKSFVWACMSGALPQCPPPFQKSWFRHCDMYVYFA